jgi:hypothetical protein
MEVFLEDHEKYTESLKRGGSGNLLKDSWRKGKWAFEMETEVPWAPSHGTATAVYRWNELK